MTWTVAFTPNSSHSPRPAPSPLTVDAALRNEAVTAGAEGQGTVADAILAYAAIAGLRSAQVTVRTGEMSGEVSDLASYFPVRVWRFEISGEAARKVPVAA